MDEKGYRIDQGCMLKFCPAGPASLATKRAGLLLHPAGPASLATQHVVLVQIAQNNAQLHNLHVEEHKYKQCLILLGIIQNCAMHNTHLMHNIVLL